MELRQLTTDHERQIFANCLAKARATRGFGFRETPRSQLGRAHLMFGDLYALFEDEGEPPERMVAGFIDHDLTTLPLSYPKPDMGHLPPESVLEGGELWSLSPGAGRVASIVAGAVAGIMQAKAIVVYSLLKPVDLTPRYAQLNFVNACEPVRWPYVETMEGGEVWVQPMIIEDERLEQYVRRGFEVLFQAVSGSRAFRFRRPFATQPMAPRVSASESAEGRASTSLISTATQGGDRNGEASQ